MTTLRGKGIWLIVAAATTMACPTGSFAYDEKLRQQFKRLDPETRLEQVCDNAVMEAVNQEVPSLKADRVIAYTFENPQMEDNTIDAPGASIRGHGKWFHIRFHCQTGPRHLDAHELSFDLGEEVPRDQWEDLNLFD